MLPCQSYTISLSAYTTTPKRRPAVPSSSAHSVVADSPGLTRDSLGRLVIPLKCSSHPLLYVIASSFPCKVSVSDLAVNATPLTGRLAALALFNHRRSAVSSLAHVSQVRRTFSRPENSSQTHPHILLILRDGHSNNSNNGMRLILFLNKVRQGKNAARCSLVRHPVPFGVDSATAVNEQDEQ